MWRDSLIWLIHVWYDSLIHTTHSYVTWLIDMTHWYVTWLIDMWHDWDVMQEEVLCDMTHWYDSFICDMTHWHDSLIRDTIELWCKRRYYVTWRIEGFKSCVWSSGGTYSMSVFHMWHDSVPFTCAMTRCHSHVTWLGAIHMCHDSFIHVTWLLHMRHLQRGSYKGGASKGDVIWLIHMWHDSFIRDMCILWQYMWHDSFTWDLPHAYDIQLIHM